ncbi:MAG TPA: hypothetical protein DCO67_03495 [Staphylococcus sp.]|nr:hypothetical protein [Staphylococcus sp.]
MNYKRIAHSIVTRLPTDIQNVSMSYLNRAIGQRTKSPYEFAEIKRVIIKEYMKQDTNNKTYKNYIKGGN